MAVPKLSVMPVFGTRPEAIKMAPVIAELAAQSDINVMTTVTAQHRHLLDQVLFVFSIVPAFDLDIMTADQSLQEITGRVMARLAPILTEHKPDLVLVHGDTTTTFAAALTSFYHKIPVGHVEAGLRTADRYRPFPEEINRRMVGQLADLHFAPTNGARRNLLKEGVEAESIFVTGNTAIDALIQTVSDRYQFSTQKIAALVTRQSRIMLVDLHRRESFGEPIYQMGQALIEIVRRFEDLIILVSVHPNPHVSGSLTSQLTGINRIHLVPPLPYPEWINLLKRSYLYVGDSGGLQEEAPALDVPVVVLRDVTERPEAIEAGTAILAGTNSINIVDICTRLLQDQDFYQRIAAASNPYGDGHAAKRIVADIRHKYGRTSARPEQFQTHSAADSRE